jgi:hypothetical protein
MRGGDRVVGAVPHNNEMKLTRSSQLISVFDA